MHFLAIFGMDPIQRELRRPCRSFIQAEYPCVSRSDWDPTKWIIYALHRYTSFVPTVAVTPEAEVLKARANVLHSQADRLHAKVPAELLPKPVEELPIWTAEEAVERAKGHLLVLIDGCFVDVTNYVQDHVSLRVLRCLDRLEG